MSHDDRLANYVTVAERGVEAHKRYPECTVQSEMIHLSDSLVVFKALFYRTPDDPRPGIGHSSMAIPGSTPFTRGSEIENCETSAWGRAMVAAFAADAHRGIASRDEIANKTPNQPSGRAVESGAAAPNVQRSSPAAAAAPDYITKAQVAAETAKANRAPTDGGDPSSVEVHFGKNQGRRLGDLAEKSVRWYAESYEDNNPKFPWGERERRLKLAAQMLCGIAPESLPAAANDVDDIPFAPVVW